MATARTSAPFHEYIAFLRRLAIHINAPRDINACTGLIVVQLTNLNRINTVAGYQAGQRASIDFALEVTKMLRESDWMTQLARDRYAIVFDRVKNSGHLILAANRIARAATSIPVPNDDNLELDVRVGAALFPDHGNNAETLLRNAEMAIETAALQGSTFSVYAEDESQQLTDDWQIEARIGQALDDQEFNLFYQPKFDARTLLPCGAEGLMRWHSTSLGQVSTERFIRIVESTDYIDALTSFALHTAARDLSEWPNHASELTVAVNLAPKVIEHGNIVSSFKNAAAIWGVPLERFTAEVTENGIISTGGKALDVLQALRDVGIRVSIDDFGTGNSSLAYFKDIPADEVKIDKSFVFGMRENESTFNLVKTIIDLAHSFSLTVVAEGVENAEVVKDLQELDCDVLQGYHFARPMPVHDFVEFLSNNTDNTAKLRAS